MNENLKVLATIQVVYIDVYGGLPHKNRGNYVVGNDETGDGTPERPFLTKERAMKEFGENAIGCIRNTHSQLIRIKD